VYFPVSGVEMDPLILLFVAFAVSALTAPASVSGAFLLLPFQISVLGFASPAVSPTNLIYNVVATPGGVYRYVREGRVVWPLAWLVALGALPGVFVGAILRVTYFSDPRAFKVFVGLVLLYLGTRLIYGALRCSAREDPTGPDDPGAGTDAGRVPGGGAVRTTEVSLRRIRYEFSGRAFSCNPVAVFLLALVVGVVGGIYSIGGGSIIAPFFVAVFRLPVYTVAGATMIGTFLTSVAGVAFFQLLAATSLGAQATVAPDWLLGAILGVGGLAGTYAGARIQRFLPDLWIRVILGLLVTLLAIGYIAR
jgi:uncharacterized membrane protein YfcA